MALPTLNDLLTSKRPNIATGMALLAVDLQNDFLSPDGKLPVTLLEGFQNDFSALVSSFRQAGQIIWVQTERSSSHDAKRDAVVTLNILSPGEGSDAEEEDSEDEFIRRTLHGKSSPFGERQSAKRTAELLRRASGRTGSGSRLMPNLSLADDLFLSEPKDQSSQCCIPQSNGAEPAGLVKSLFNASKDFVTTKHSYSAFNSTHLLFRLRLRMITKLYICGSLTNVSVYATAMDAVSHGFQVTVIEDCLGYRSRDAHEQALKRMVDVIGAERITASSLTNELLAATKLNMDTKNPDLGEESAEAVPTIQMEKMNINPNPVDLVNPNKNIEGGRIRQNEPGLANINRSESLYYAISTQHTLSPSFSVPRAQTPPSTPLALVEPTRANSVEVLRNQTESAQDEQTLPQLVHWEDVQTTGGKKETVQVEWPQISPMLVESAQSEPTLATGTTTVAAGTLEKPSNSTYQPLTMKIDTTPQLKLPGDKIGEGDSYVIYDFIPQVEQNLFSTVKNEIHWQKMFHARGEVPRLVCVQGVFGQDGSMPVYRHPVDQSLPMLHLSPKVQVLKREVENIVGHSMNHVLIQLYRSGEDYISEHSDKTLDIVHGSKIVNVSFGAQRTMRLRTKRLFKAERIDSLEKNIRQTELIPLPHCSMFVLGLQTNKCWLHGINHDKRPTSQKSDAENAFGGERISLTFRFIGTYLDSKSQMIWGQGACAKLQAGARSVVNGDSEINQHVITAFGYENQQTTFDWDAVYGRGFDVLHFSAALEETPLFFPSGSYLRDMKIKIFLEELGVSYRTDGVRRNETGTDYSPEVCFRDVDAQKTQVYGDIPILLYLAHTRPDRLSTEPLIAEACSQLWQLRNILSTATPHSSLAKLDQVLDGRLFLAGDAFSFSDCAYWPVVDEIVETWEPWNPQNFPRVASYHERVLSRASVKRAVCSDSKDDGG